VAEQPLEAEVCVGGAELLRARQCGVGQRLERQGEERGVDWMRNLSLSLSSIFLILSRALLL